MSLKVCGGLLWVYIVYGCKEDNPIVFNTKSLFVRKIRFCLFKNLQFLYFWHVLVLFVVKKLLWHGIILIIIIALCY